MMSKIAKRIWLYVAVIFTLIVIIAGIPKGAYFIAKQHEKHFTADIEKHTSFAFGNGFDRDKALQKIVKKDLLEFMTQATREYYWSDAPQKNKGYASNFGEYQDMNEYLKEDVINSFKEKTKDRTRRTIYALAKIGDRKEKDAYKWFNDTKKINYLDILLVDVQVSRIVSGKNEYQVQVSEDNIAMLKKHRQAILAGKVKLRPLNLENINDIKNGQMYTYQKDKNMRNSPYKIFNNAYDTGYNNSDILNVFLYKEKHMTDFHRYYGAVTTYYGEAYKEIDKLKLIIQEQDNDLLKIFNQRKVSSVKDKYTLSNNVTLKIKDKTFNVSTDNEKWLAYLKKKNQSAKEIIVFHYDQSLVDNKELKKIVKKYIDDHHLQGRDMLDQALSGIKKDIQKNGENSPYFVEYSISPDYMIDFGRGIKETVHLREKENE